MTVLLRMILVIFYCAEKTVEEVGGGVKGTHGIYEKTESITQRHRTINLNLH